jgi:hypothetical protein
MIHTRSDFIREKMNCKEFIGGLLAEIHEHEIRVFKTASTRPTDYVSLGQHLENVVFFHAILGVRSCT